MTTSHAGSDKWELVKKERYNFLQNVKWNGRTYSLDKFTNLHRAGFVILQEAALHVDFQLPSEHSRVGFLLDNITSADPDLRAALASIRANTNNIRDNFEEAVKFMLPVCSYTKHKNNQKNKRRHAEILDTRLKGKADSKTGVDLRWHTADEYRKLSKDQKHEIWLWQKTKEGQEARNKSSNGKMSKYKMRAHIKSLEKRLKKQDSDETEDEPKNKAIPTISEISAVLAAVCGTKLPPKPTQQPILKPSTTNKDKDNGDNQPYKAAAAAVQQIIKRSRKS